MDEPSDKIDLTRMNPAYCGGFQKIEVVGFSKGIHDEPGIYLQKVEGCGYDVWTLSPDEADALADILKRIAAETRAEFPEEKNDTQRA